MIWRHKHPRIPHLPWSEGFVANGPKADLKLSSIANFKKQHVVVTIKMDGMNTSMYTEWIHARSTEFLMRHESTHLVKTLWQSVRHDIPDGWRVCGENLHAKHSIHYKSLPSFFLVHSVWDDRGKCLPWCETEEWAELLGFPTVPVIYCGMFDYNIVRHMHMDEYNGDKCEGFVIRHAGSFERVGAHLCMAKFVRRGHVQTDEHWLNQPVVFNELEG